MKVIYCILILLFVSCNNQKAENNEIFHLQSITTQKAKKHISENKVTFLEVGSESCYSCKVMGSNIENVKSKERDFNVIFVDVFKDATGLREFKVEAIPTQIVLNSQGEELYRHIGVLNPDEINLLINKYKILKNKENIWKIKL